MDIAAAFRQDQDRWYFLTEAMQQRPTLFWGYRMADSGTLEALHPATVKGRPLQDRWITLTPDTDEGTRRYFRALGFNLVVANTQELLQYFAAHVFVPTKLTGRLMPTRDIFPEYAIPDVGVVPVRSLLDFYRGSSPSWYEIFSGRLHNTKHHVRVRNSLSAGRNTILIGVPACGKTTLMMQVMKDFPFDGYKLVCEAPTAEKASLIVKGLDGNPALIAIDNFADSMDALLSLSSSSSIQVLACDRDYNFEIVSHLLERSKFDVLDVSELDPEDIQALLEHIPMEIRYNSPRKGKTEVDNRISLFELVESNVRLPNLRQRFAKVLTELAKRDRRLLDFLLVCAYVHSCRAPVSSDMLLAYFRDEVEYDMITEMRERLGGLLTEYTGALDDGLQDYFVPRSTIVAEAIIGQASPGDLKRVIERFHQNVSTVRIHRYDIFIKQAFDANTIGQAFLNWEDGYKFYKEASLRDTSPYLLQQAALYLAHKKRYSEAFSMIDEALVRGGHKIFSIRNSHAIILFRANIEREDKDGTVKRTLQESLSILEDCYRHDRRKAYHAVTYADHSLRYDLRYGRGESEDYLKTALGWLRQEEQRSPWNRNVKKLRELVTRRLGR
jgi:hypothetical protein